MSRIISISLVLLLLASCKKEPIFAPNETIGETPIFKVEGKLGNNPVLLTAGIDGMEQSTRVEIVDGVTRYVGILGHDSTILMLSIFDGKLGLPFDFETITSQTINFANLMEVWFSINKAGLTNAPMIQKVNFISGSGSSLNTYTVIGSGIHNLCAEVHFNDGTIKTVCNNLMLGFKDYGAFKVDFSTNAGSPTNVKIVGNSSSFSSVKWYVDGVFRSQNEILTLEPGFGPVKVKTVVTFQNGITREREVIVDTDGQGRFFEDITQDLVVLEESLMNDFSLMIDYIDQTGHYIENGTLQNTGDFNISSINLFKTLTNGNKVYKIDGEIVGDLFHVQTGNILPLQLQISFAIEVP